MKKSAVIAGLSVLVAGLFAVPVWGQSSWLPPTKGNAIILEGMKANYNDLLDPKFLSSAWFLSGRYQVSNEVALVAEIPFSYFEFNNLTFTDDYGNDLDIEPDKTLFGNPYFGVEYENSSTPLVFQGGIRVPVVSDNNYNERLFLMRNGQWTDAVRWTAFYPEAFFVHAMFGGKVVSEDEKLTTRILIGGDLMIPKTDGADTEFLVNLQSDLWYSVNEFKLGIDFNVLTLVTESRGDFKDKSEFQLGFGGAYNFEHFRPGLHIHFPLGDPSFTGSGWAEDYVIGFNLTYFFGDREM